MRNILLTGKDGQVGHELEKSLKALGKVHAFNRQTFNLENESQMREIIREIKPGIIVNAAAYTAVDKAESDIEAAYAVNAVAPKILAEVAKKIGALLVHYSTDYVFDGISKDPSRLKPFLENDLPNPLNVYGNTKLEGEKFIQTSGVNYLIFRTSWVYGLIGKNFLLTMLRLAKERETLSVVNDQFGAPTWSRAIAETTSNVLTDCIQKSCFDEVSGLYHLTASGLTSWHGFATEIFKCFKEIDKDFKIPHLKKISTSEYPLPAKRPPYSALSNEKLNKVFNVVMPDWKDSLKQCLNGQPGFALNGQKE